MLRFRGSSIQSYMPSEDPRATDQLRILGGRNIAWDSRGPKSGFTTRRLSPFPLTRPQDVQGLRIGPRTFIFTQDAILEWRDMAPIGWDVHVTFDYEIPLNLRTPWQGIYLNGNTYLAQQHRGMIRGRKNIMGKIIYESIDDSDIPGLIPYIQGLDVVRGRPILVNNDTIQWGALGNMTDLTPGLGGAGFQLLAQFIDGDFLALTSFQDGFIVWTTKGAVVAEYIGGDEVWRFDNLRIFDKPFGDDTVVTMLAGGQIFVSAQGVNMLDGVNSKPLTPEFNEFFRAYVIDRFSAEVRWRVEYDDARQQIFIMESNDLVTYTNCFVLYPTLNKWGIFSEKNYGILPLTNELYGYVDQKGFCHYFIDTINRGADPEVEEGLTRIYPRIQHQQTVLSSSAVSTAFAMNAVTLPARPMHTGWYDVGSDMPRAEGMIGLDSIIQVGYFRPADLTSAIDANVEIQKFIFGSTETQSPETQETMTSLTDWKADWFYVPMEDWNESGPSEDWNTNGLAEDWMWSGSLRPKVNHNIEVYTSEDGITVDIREVSLSKFYTGAWKYASMTLGVMNMIQISAIDVNQYWHWKYMEFQMQYGGESGL